MLIKHRNNDSYAPEKDAVLNWPTFHAQTGRLTANAGAVSAAAVHALSATLHAN